MKKLLAYHFYFITACFIGIATVTAAFVIFCASLWGSTASANYSKATNALNEANTSYLEYTTQFIHDDLRELRLMSGGLTEKEAEIETNEASQDIHLLLKEYEDAKHESDELLGKADFANTQGDRFQLVAMLLSIVLFLASLSITAKSQSMKNLFFTFALILYICSIAFLTTFSFPQFM